HPRMWGRAVITTRMTKIRRWNGSAIFEASIYGLSRGVTIRHGEARDAVPQALPVVHHAAASGDHRHHRHGGGRGEKERRGRGLRAGKRDADQRVGVREWRRVVVMEGHALLVGADRGAVATASMPPCRD